MSLVNWFGALALAQSAMASPPAPEAPSPAPPASPAPAAALKLSSGGPLRTIEEFRAGHVHSPPGSPKDHVMCQWFDEKHNCRTARFPVAGLDLD